MGLGLWFGLGFGSRLGLGFQLLGHARVAAAVVHDEALHEPRLHARSVLHVHDLDHVQIDGLALAPDAAHLRGERVGRGEGEGGGVVRERVA